MASLIRINLLPVRQTAKKQVGQQVLVLGVVVLLGTGIGNYLWLSSTQERSDKLQAKIDDTQRRITELEKVIGEVNNINKRKKEVEDKLKILNELRKGRSGPVRMLDALATAIPNKVAISDFTESNNQVKLAGRAVSHEDVAEFMKSLSTIVWTPKGIGRIVERKRDATNMRVELLAQGGAIEDFNLSEVNNFFSNIELSKASQVDERVNNNPVKRVVFDINLACNYAI
jgi:type IV pilus assembly protein PilN